MNSNDPPAAPSPCLDGAALFLERASVCREAGEVDTAFALLAEGEAAFPRRADFSALRAELLNLTGQPDRALEAAFQALRLDPADQTALFARAFAYFLLEAWEDAIEALGLLLTHYPSHPSGNWLRAGTLRRCHGDLDPRVLSAFDTACAVDAGNLFLAVERADVLRALGRYQEARAVYSRIASPGTCLDEALRAEAAFSLSLICLIEGDVEAARIALMHVLDIAPDYPDAQTLYDTL